MSNIVFYLLSVKFNINIDICIGDGLIDVRILNISDFDDLIDDVGYNTSIISSFAMSFFRCCRLQKYCRFLGTVPYLNDIQHSKT